jgi:hypothetical protein
MRNGINKSLCMHEYIFSTRFGMRKTPAGLLLNIQEACLSFTGNGSTMEK